VKGSALQAIIVPSNMCEGATDAGEGRKLEKSGSWRRAFAHWTAILGFLVLVLVLAVDGAFAATKVLADADNGAKVRLKTGERFEVRLKSNPSTGFMWSVEAESTPLLKLVSQSQTRPAVKGVGRPIMQIFKFAAIAGGEGELVLHYVRSWEKPVPDEKQFTVHVVVK
jgi:inhibitor of cysteine peptidase